MRVSTVAALVAILALAACKPLTSTICSTEARPSLRVSLADSITGQIGPFRNVTMVAVDGAYKDSVFVGNIPANPTLNVYPLATEHAGTLTLTITADGYHTWTKSGLFVDHDECHVFPVSLGARLAPL